MNGRKQITKLGCLIRFFEFLSRLVPKFVFNFLWDLFDNSESKLPLLIKYLYVRKYTYKCGENVFIGKSVTLKNIHNLTLGSNISIHAQSYIDAAGEITIGDNVSIANQTSLISFEHTWGDKSIPIKYNKVKKASIIIKDDVWIGTGCRILSGVTLCSRSIVAAGAVVTRDVLPNSIVGGIPAQKIKDME